MVDPKRPPPYVDSLLSRRWQAVMYQPQHKTRWKRGSTNQYLSPRLLSHATGTLRIDHMSIDRMRVMRHLTTLAVAVFLVVTATAGCSDTESSESAVAAPTTSVPEVTTTTVPEVPTTTTPAPEVAESAETTPEPPLCIFGDLGHTQSIVPVIRVNYTESVNDRGDMEATIRWEVHCAEDDRAEWRAEEDWHLINREYSEERGWWFAEALSDPGIPVDIRISALNGDAQTVVRFTLFD